MRSKIASPTDKSTLLSPTLPTPPFLNQSNGAKKARSKSAQSLFSLYEKSLPIEQKITDVLLSNNAALLTLICQTSFVGDTAATVSLGILSLLRKYPGATEVFLKKLLLNRRDEFVRKQRDISDLIRDNSMSTMLLNAYARYEGMTYLNKCVGIPFQKASLLIEDCEIDPQKLSEDGTKTREEKSSENEKKLCQATLLFLSGILEGTEVMPQSMRTMCRFLHYIVVDQTLNSQQSSLQHLARPKNESRSFPDILNPGTPTKTKTKELQQNELKSGSPSANTNDESRFKLLRKLSQHARKSSNPPLLSASLDVSDVKSKDQSRRNSTHSSKYEEYRASASTTSSDRNLDGIGATASLGILTVAEKLVGSFLFLRFFIPAITAPDNYGFSERKITPAGRRGLILIGKLMTALCNDLEFGTKDTYLTSLNTFLKDHRERVKGFLHTVSSPMSKLDGITLDEIINNQSEALSTSLNIPSTPLKKQTISSSLPSLIIHNPTSQSRQKSKSSTKTQLKPEFDESFSLFAYLGKSINKIEKDVQGKDVSDTVWESFMELKKLIDASPYTVDKIGGKKKNGESILSKLGRFSQFFSIGRLEQKSMDDLTSARDKN